MNWDCMTLSSDNKEKFNDIMKYWEPSGIRIDRREDKDGEVYFKSQPVPHDAVKELSAKHPDMTFTADCSFEHEWWRQVFQIEYKVGGDRLVNIKANYMWPYGNVATIPKADIEQLEEKITQIFRRIDPFIPEQKKIDWYPNEVMVSAEQGEWKMEATKAREQVIDVKVYRKKITTAWEKIDLKEDIDGFIPEIEDDLPCNEVLKQPGQWNKDGYHIWGN